MSWYVIDALDDSLGATRELLLPFELRRLLKLAVIVFFLGGSGISVPNANVGGFSPGDEPMPVPGRGELLPDTGLLAFVAIAAIVILLIALVFAAVSSIMEFVFVEALRTRMVRVRIPLRHWWKSGLRLLGFRISIALAVFVPIVGLGAAIFLTTPAFDPSLVPLLVFVPLIFALVFLLSLVNSLTTAFVVPIMLVEECGPLNAWRRFWPTLRSQWLQYGFYVVVAFVAGIAGAILVWIVCTLVAILLAIPLSVVGLVVLFVTGGFSGIGLPGLILLGILVVLFLLVILLTALLASVPVTTYLRYLALFVLGDSNEEFDLIPSIRTEIRE